MPFALKIQILFLKIAVREMKYPRASCPVPGGLVRIAHLKFWLAVGAVRK